MSIFGSTIIYQAIDEVEAALKGMLKPEYEEVQLGSAEVREVYRSSKFGNIAGAIVRNGLVKRNAKARLIRDGVVVAENLKGRVAASIQRMTRQRSRKDSSAVSDLVLSTTSRLTMSSRPSK